MTANQAHIIVHVSTKEAMRAVMEPGETWDAALLALLKCAEEVGRKPKETSQ